MNYVQLAKPRSVLLLLVTAVAGMVVASPGLPAAYPLLFAILAGALAAGGANALNCYLDRDLDSRMARTAGRPLARGMVQPAGALLFGIALCVASVLVFGLFVNWLSAGLAAFGAFYYVVVYTLWLKRSSHWNVVVGGIAGCMPLLVGSAAGTGHLAPLAVWLGIVVLLWTPPHFWSLALLRTREYSLAGIPMLPVVKGREATRRQILGYSVALFLSTLLLVPAGFAGLGFLVVALTLGAALLSFAIRLWVSGSDPDARRLYGYSIVYLAILFSAIIIDRASGWIGLIGIA